MGSGTLMDYVWTALVVCIKGNILDEFLCVKKTDSPTISRHSYYWLLTEDKLSKRLWYLSMKTEATALIMSYDNHKDAWEMFDYLSWAYNLQKRARNVKMEKIRWDKIKMAATVVSNIWLNQKRKRFGEDGSRSDYLKPVSSAEAQGIFFLLQ